MSLKYARNVTVMPSERDETDVMLDPRESDWNEGRIREGSWDPMLMLPRQNPALHAVSVCEDCWKGPFAMHFGIPCTSPQNGKWYLRRWPKEMAYVTTLAEVKSRADAGCVWCRYILENGQRQYGLLDGKVTVTVRGARKDWGDDSAWRKDYQTFKVYIYQRPIDWSDEDDSEEDDPNDRLIVCAAPGAPCRYSTRIVQVTGITCRRPRGTLHHNTKSHSRRRISSCPSPCETAH